MYLAILTEPFLAAYFSIRALSFGVQLLQLSRGVTAFRTLSPSRRKRNHHTNEESINTCTATYDNYLTLTYAHLWYVILLVRI